MRFPRARSVVWFLVLVGAAWGLRATFLQRVQWNLDEGATLTMAQQVREGAVLYRDAVDNRGPLVPYLKAAVFAIAGDWNVHAVHVLLALALGVAAFLLWDLCRRLGDAATGRWAAGAFTVLALLLPGTTDSLAAHTEWFLILFSTLGFWLFALLYRNGGYLSGFLVGVAFGAGSLCKQPGLLDLGVTWIVLALIARSEPAQRARVVRVWLGECLGIAAVGALTILYFWSHGALADFAYYSWTYNTKLYIPAVPFLERLTGVRLPFRLAAEHAPAAGLLGLGGHVLALRRVWPRHGSPIREVPILAWLILGWSATGLISTTLSGRGFDHYAIQVVPGLSLACGWMLARFAEWLRRPAVSTLWIRRAGWLAIMTAIAWTLFDVARFRRALNAHDDANEAQLFSLVQQHSSPKERIFVWGYYPSIYLMAQRLPSTRFIYTNYLTGLIPWTNLDPLIDTQNTVVPGSWDRLAEDLARRPPALIVDTLGTRGYFKYPLNDQPLLWNEILQHFAQVSVRDSQKMGLRLFRRLRTDAAQLPRSLRTDSAIKISGYNSFRRHEPPQVHVMMPSGARGVELYAGAERVAAIEYPASRAVDVLFFADPSTHPGAVYRAVVTNDADGRAMSEPFDLARYVTAVTTAPISGPLLHFGSAVFHPRSVDSASGAIERSGSDKWRINAPTEIEYDCPEELEKISFIHELVEPEQMLSDGYDLVLDLIENSGRRTRLSLQRLHPISEGKDRLPQHTRLILPAGHGPGRLIFRFLAGERNNPDADRIDVSDIQAQDEGPPLRLGDREIPPFAASANGTQAMRMGQDGRWFANAPARVEWKRPPSLAALTFEYGIQDGAFTANAGHSDGVEFSLVLVEYSGKTHSLFTRQLTPYNHPEHRGPQSSRVELPRDMPGRLILNVGPGPRNDISWDWAWLGSIVGEGPGPDIILSPQRRLAAASSRTVNATGAPSKRLGEDRWDAHADSELVYTRPQDLARITFQYGLADGAIRDDSGRQRTDGVDVLVQLEFTNGKRTELFRKNLDPFHRTADAGLQTSTVQLPAHEEGRIIFRITPGPAGSNAYDWAYWGRFTGEIYQ